jgi:pimeloyl-ACP methyl ester carboxylesterase
MSPSIASVPALAKRTLILAAVAAAVCAAGRSSGQDSEDGVLVERDDQTGSTTIIVPAPGGVLLWSDVLHGLTRAAGFDAAPFPREIDRASVDLTERRAALGMLALSAAVPDVTLRVINHPRTSEPALSIRIDGDDLQDKVRRVKSLVRRQFGQDAEISYGLRFDEGWTQRPRERPLVVLVHGYSSRPGSLDACATRLSERDWPWSTFAYPNDGPLVESGALLAKELRAFGAAHPDRDVVLVAYSMGGLVARAAVEDPQLNPGNVRRLIMVCTPNHGTQWAKLPGGLDCWEHLPRLRERALIDAFRSSIADGLNEARADIKPQSRFLRELNARPRNADVHYSLILGTGAPFTAAQIADLRQFVTRSLARDRRGQVLLSRIAEFFDNVEELQSGKGDWVVSVQRGRLEGVRDTVLLPITHWDFTSATPSPAQSDVFQAILDRLSR